MFLHLGGGTAVPSKTILGIYDWKLIGSDKERVALWEKEGRLIHLEEEPSEVRSVVVTTKKVYLSILMTMTLARRARDPLARV